MTGCAVASDTTELRVSSEFRNGHVVREFVRGWAEANSLRRDAIPDLLLAVTEVFNNAVEHAHRFRTENEVAVRLRRRAEALQVDVTDQGPGFVPTEPLTPDQVLPTQRGLGLYLARQLVDEVTFTQGVGTTVHLVKHLGSSQQ